MSAQWEANDARTSSLRKQQLQNQLIALKVFIQEEHIPDHLQMTCRDVCQTLLGYEKHCEADDNKAGKSFIDKDSILYRFYTDVNHFLAALRRKHGEVFVCSFSTECAPVTYAAVRSFMGHSNVPDKFIG